MGAWFALNIPIGSEIILGQLMVLAPDVGHVETHFGPFGDSVKLDAW
jgi:hypothetical protein